MKRITETEIFANAILTFGIRSQMDMLTEEVGELLSALNKYKRGRVSADEVITEIAAMTVDGDSGIYMRGGDFGYAVAFKPFFDAVSQTQMYITSLFYIYCIPACKLRPQAPVLNHRRCTQATRL